MVTCDYLYFILFIFITLCTYTHIYSRTTSLKLYYRTLSQLKKNYAWSNTSGRAWLQLPLTELIKTSAVVGKMAHSLADLDVPMDADQPGEFGKEVLRRCRGRPRLTDSDRAQRRLESRKKYDVRRVYLGESHKLWSELRRRTSLSDAGLAEYLILLNSTYGEKYLQKYNRLVVPVNLRKRFVSSLLATGKLSVSNVHSNIFKKGHFMFQN